MVNGSKIFEFGEIDNVSLVKTPHQSKHNYCKKNTDILVGFFHNIYQVRLQNQGYRVCLLRLNSGVVGQYMKKLSLSLSFLQRNDDTDW
jgi:hypothetical protein